MGLPFRMGGAIPTAFLSHVPVCTAGTLSPPTVGRGFVWAGPGWLADPLVLTSQVASAKFSASKPYCTTLPT